MEPRRGCSTPLHQLTRDDGGQDWCTRKAGAVPEHEAAASQLRTAVHRRAKVVKVWRPKRLRKLQHYLKLTMLSSIGPDLKRALATATGDCACACQIVLVYSD